jgi:hypothetical protein
VPYPPSIEDLPVFSANRGGIRYPKPKELSMTDYEENFGKAFNTVLGMRRMAENAWDDEQLEAAHAIMELQAQAYDEAFTDCEEQDSGFAGTTGWTNRNPYRKSTAPNV